MASSVSEGMKRLGSTSFGGLSTFGRSAAGVFASGSGSGGGGGGASVNGRRGSGSSVSSVSADGTGGKDASGNAVPVTQTNSVVGDVE